MYLRLLALILTIIGLTLTVCAETCVWTGAAGDGRWSSAENWTRSPEAGRNDIVEIDIGSTPRAMTNDLVGLTLTQLRLLGANDACLTLSGEALTLSPTAGKIGFPALTNHCSLVLNVPLRLTATGTLAFYGKDSTVNGAITADDGVAFRLRCRQSRVADDASLVGNCTFTVNGRIDGPGAEMHLVLGGNGRGVITPFNAPVNVGALYEGEATSSGTARFKTSDNEIGRIVFSAPAIYADVDNAFTTNTVIELGHHPDKASTWCWTTSGIVFAPGTEQVANRLNGRPLNAKGVGQTLRVADSSDKSGAATLRLHGTTNAVTYVALSDVLSVVWEPAGDFTQDFRDRIHTGYGGLSVMRGTMRSSGTNCFVRMRTLSVGAGAAFEAASTNLLGLFPNLSVLDLSEGSVFRVTESGAACPQFFGEYTHANLDSCARFELPAGAAIALDRITVCGEGVASGGTFTGAANPNPGEATIVDWIVGAGVITTAAEPKTREERVLAVPAGEGGIQAALDVVREIRTEDVDTPLVIELASGDHRLNGNVLNLTYEHARRVWAPLTIRAADAENRPRVLGGFAVTNVWRKGLFPGRDDVWSADVTTLTNQFAADVFWFDGKRMGLAQWPNRNPERPYTTGFAFVDATWGSAKTLDGWYLDELKIRDSDSPPEWSDPTEGFVRVYPRHNWNSSMYSVVSISDGLIRLNRSREVPEEMHYIWDRYTMYGQRENLDQEGEWYLDRANRLLHFIPPAGKDPNDGYAALCTDGASMTVKKAENLSLEHLDFTCMHEALSIASGSDQIAVRACRFYELGGFDGCAVSSSDATNVAITDCDLHHLGASGVRISDTLKTTDGRSNQLVENCYVHHIGDTTPAACGIALYGQGNVVRHNLVHDVARIGVRGYGRFSDIAYNRVRHVNLTSDDCACIYGGGWSIGCGARVLHNWVSDNIGYKRNSSDDQRNVYYTHYSPSAWGLYIDEAGGGVEVAGNLVTDISTAGGMHLHSARWSTITNNIFALDDCGKCMMNFQSWRSSTLETRTNSVLPTYEKLIAADPRWTDYPALAQSPRCDETTYCDDGSVIMGTVVERNIFYYPSAVSKPAHTCTSFNLVTNRFDNNLYWPGEKDGTTPRDRFYVKSSSNPRTSYDLEVWQDEKHEDVHSLVADPQFVTPGGRDGRLKPTSPALALGFAPLDVAEKAGLQVTKWRPVLPVEEEGVREHPEYLADMATVTTWTAGSGAWGEAQNWDAGIPTARGTAIIPAKVPDQVVAVSSGDMFAPNRLYVGDTGDETMITVTGLVKSAAATFSGEEAVFAGRSVLANSNSYSVAVVYPSVAGTVSRLVFRDHARLGGTRYDTFTIGNDRDSIAGEAIVEFESDATHTIGYTVHVGSPNGTGTLSVRNGHVSEVGRGVRVGCGTGGRYSECKQSGGNGTLNVSGGALVVSGGVVSEGQVRGLIVGESFSRLSAELKKSYVPWQGRVNLSGGVITNTSNCLIGGARGTGTFVQTGGLYVHKMTKKTCYPFIVGCAGGTGECQFAGGEASIVGDVYVGGIFTNDIPHGTDMKYSLGAYGWPLDDHSAVGRLTLDGGKVAVSGDLNIGHDGSGTLVLGGADAPIEINGDLVLSNALVRIERRHGAFVPIHVTGKIINSAGARFSVDLDSFAGIVDETLVIRADGGWEGPPPAQEGTEVAILWTVPDGLMMTLRNNWVSPLLMPGETADERCEAALVMQGFSAKVAESLGTTWLYTSFRGWAEQKGIAPDGLTTKTGVILASAYDASKVEDPTNVTVNVEELSIRSGLDDGKEMMFSVVVGGYGPTVANLELLKASLDLEGAYELVPAGFSSDSLDYAFGELLEGKLPVTVVPKKVGQENPSSFFIRVKAR